MRRLNGPFIGARKLGGNWVRFEAWLESTSVLRAAWPGNYGWKLQKVGIATPPLPLVLFVWVEREDVPGTATHGHHNLITSGYGDKLSRSTSEPLPLDGRLSRLLAAKSDRGRSLCTVAGFISNFSELDPATGRTRKSRRENGTTRVSPTGMWIYILVSFDSMLGGNRSRETPANSCDPSWLQVCVGISWYQNRCNASKTCYTYISIRVSWRGVPCGGNSQLRHDYRAAIAQLFVRRWTD